MGDRTKRPHLRNQSLKRENIRDHMNAHIHVDGSIGYYEICDAGCLLDAKCGDAQKEEAQPAACTVDKLIATLQGLSDVQKALPINLEGCDCFGKWNGKVEEYNHAILLLRSEG